MGIQRYLLKKRRIGKIIRFYNTEKGVKYIPYYWGSRFINWYTGTNIAIEKHYNHKTGIIREFIADYPDKFNEWECKVDFIRMNLLHGWRVSAFNRLSDRRYFKRLKMTGYDTFLRFYKLGKGIIVLNAHYGLPQVPINMFPALGYSDFYTMVGERYEDSMKNKAIKEKRRANLLTVSLGSGSDSFKALYEAKGILNKGGILHLLGDGKHGSSAETVDFLGKKWSFRSSFAQLALLTESPVIPVFATPDWKGNMHVEFHTPLDPGTQEMEQEERIRFMIEQYAKILEAKWLENPSFVAGGFMDMYNRKAEG